MTESYFTYVKLTVGSSGFLFIGKLSLNICCPLGEKMIKWVCGQEIVIASGYIAAHEIGKNLIWYTTVVMCSIFHCQVGTSESNTIHKAFLL